jgi:hypothetical protein
MRAATNACVSRILVVFSAATVAASTSAAPARSCAERSEK